MTEPLYSALLFATTQNHIPKTKEKKRNQFINVRGIPSNNGTFYAGKQTGPEAKEPPTLGSEMRDTRKETYGSSSHGMAFPDPAQDAEWSTVISELASDFWADDRTLDGLKALSGRRLDTLWGSGEV